MNKILTTLRLLMVIAVVTGAFAAALLGQAATSVVPAAARAGSVDGRELWRQVEVVRTAHGVPHIRAENLRAAGYALAWMQSEDYGPVTAMEVLEASGRWASVAGYERVESDFTMRRYRDRVFRNYHLLMKETRDVYEGFAAGVNRYVELHPEEFPAGMPADFSG